MHSLQNELGQLNLAHNIKILLAHCTNSKETCMNDLQTTANKTLSYLLANLDNLLIEIKDKTHNTRCLFVSLILIGHNITIKIMNASHIR